MFSRVTSPVIVSGGWRASLVMEGRSSVKLPRQDGGAGRIRTRNLPGYAHAHLIPRYQACLSLERAIFGLSPPDPVTGRIRNR